VLVGLVEQARYDARPESAHAVMRHRMRRLTPHLIRTRRLVDESEEVALAHAVAAEDGDALAVPEFEIERVGQSVDLQPFADDGAFARAGAA
jgi:hypothetical protein